MKVHHPKITVKCAGLLLLIGFLPFTVGAAGHSRQFAGSHSAPGIRLETIYAGKIKDVHDGESLKVFIQTNGVISRYESYTTENPARIVFDIFDVKSPYTSERTIPVDTDWVRRVRYNGFPDRLRVILETKSAYLNHYTAFPIENGLIVHIGDSPALMTTRHRTPAPVRESAVMPTTPAGLSNRFGNIYATRHEDGILISVRADQTITNFRPSIIQHPPQIVYEIFDLDMGTEKEKIIDVGSPEVSRIRYIPAGNKLRMEIETSASYLSAFSSYPDKRGMVIQVGSRDLAARTHQITVPEYPADIAPYGLSGQGGEAGVKGPTAWVDRIDFIDEGQGKTTLIIGTTNEVSYDLQKISDQSLVLRLHNTRIPPYRQRPLITDRFDSAVDDIRPLAPKDNTSEFSIKLRETVPHFVEQAGNMIMVHFEPSAQPPKPSEIAAMPSWQSVLPPEGQQPGTQVPAAAPPPLTTRAAAPSPLAAAHPPQAAALPSYMEPPVHPLEELLSSQPRPTQYTGEKIALDFYKTDIKNVFRILREVSGLNFAVERDVQGEVTLTLDKPVPWDQVLDLVLKMNRLGKTAEGDIIRIATQATLEREEAEREKRRQEEIKAIESRRKVEPLFTEYIPVNYSNAEGEMKPHIEKILTPERGTVSVDKRTNMIIITDTREKIRQAVEIIERLDRVTPQVVIEARIVEVDTTFAKQFGVEWGADSGIFNTDQRAGIGPQRSYHILGGTYGYGMSVNLPPATYTGSLGFDFKRIAGTPFTLNARLRAMESRDEAKIISAPKILTLDNKPAIIKQGIEIPYAVTDRDGNVTVMFKEVNLELNVTPQITPDDRIAITLKITKNDLVGAQQQISTKEAQTEFLINDGDTIVIGGIRKTNIRFGTSEFPGMAKIPLLGWLFKSKNDMEESQELLIFITTKIMQLEQRAVRTTS